MAVVAPLTGAQGQGRDVPVHLDDVLGIATVPCVPHLDGAVEVARQQVGRAHAVHDVETDAVGEYVHNTCGKQGGDR